MEVYEIRNYLILTVVWFGFIGTLYERVRFKLKGTVVRAKIVQYVQNQQGFAIPVLEFEYGGQRYQMCAESMTKTPKYTVGSEHDIYFIPGYRKKVKIIKDYNDYFTAFFLLLAGILITIGIF
ncbi:MAG: hypothetical protein IJA10_03465 [Lachnospiraceae bacterium]|nr:hypothetical protein [Lachnospiraceae bacterium]